MIYVSLFGYFDAPNDIADVIDDVASRFERVSTQTLSAEVFLKYEIRFLTSHCRLHQGIDDERAVARKIILITTSSFVIP